MGSGDVPRVILKFIPIHETTLRDLGIPLSDSRTERGFRPVRLREIILSQAILKAYPTTTSAGR
jgi:hypothetical protein